MPKVKITISNTSLELKGSNAFLRTELVPTIEMITQRLNAELRRELGDHLRTLESCLAEMNGDVGAMQQVNRESIDLFNRFLAALHEQRKQIEAAVGGGDTQALLNATKQMQETQMSFNLQYLQLQSQMQHENRSYTAVSNIMKTKHDTVKNSISNIR